MTNATGTNAQFGAENVWEGDTISWITREISHREGSNWVAWNSHTVPPLDWLHPGVANPSRYPVFVLIPVETTSAVSRIVIELIKRPKGLAGFFEEIRETQAKLRGRGVDTAYHGPRFFLTNETVIGAKP